MLNKQSLQAVSQLRDISDSFVFTYPITGVKNAGNTIVAFLDVSKLGSEEFEEFGIIKFKEFNDLINLAGSDSDVTLKDGVLNIIGKNIKCRYFTTDTSVLEESFKANIKMLEKTAAADAALEFSISSSELNQIKKVASLLNVEDLVILSSNGKVTISTENSTQKSSNGFTIESENGIVNSDTNVILGMSNFKKLPDGDYNVKVAVNGTSYITRFDSTTIDGLVVNIATKAC